MADKVLSTITVQGLDDIPDGTYVNNPESTAGQFSASKAYVIGDHVFYNRKLYKFTSAHAAGAWNAAHVSEVTIGDEIKALDGDVAGLKNDFNQFPNGTYPNMSVGNADQLTATVGIEDNAPYLFRTSGGSNDIGDRKDVKKVIGGTIVWNQQIQSRYRAVTSLVQTVERIQEH